MAQLNEHYDNTVDQSKTYENNWGAEVRHLCYDGVRTVYECPE